MGGDLAASLNLLDIFRDMPQSEQMDVGPLSSVLYECRDCTDSHYEPDSAAPDKE
jgi:hypothetical protein